MRLGFWIWDYLTEAASWLLPTLSEETRFELSVPGLPVGWKERPMKQRKTKSRQADDSLRPEYDFSQGVRGKHAARYAAGTNVVVLEPDVASAFPTAEAVNEALRALAQIMRRRASSRKRTNKIA